MICVASSVPAVGSTTTTHAGFCMWVPLIPVLFLFYSIPVLDSAHHTQLLTPL